ncbi:MAG: hypothetical protein ACOCRK_09570 [bacterium]
MGFSENEIRLKNSEHKDIEEFEEKTNINVPQNERLKSYQWAEEQVGSTQYAKDNNINNFDNGTWKCNKFVADAYTKGAGINDYPEKKELVWTWKFCSSTGQ